MSGNSAKRVLIVGHLDGFGNSLKALEVQRFLREQGHEVRLFDTAGLSRASTSAHSLRRRLPALEPRKIALYVNEMLSALVRKCGEWGRRHLTYYVLMADHHIRRAILKKELPLEDFDLVICETPNNAGVLTVAGRTRTLFDCPTPWADDIYLQQQLTERQYARLRSLDIRLLESVDHLSFHWESYGRYVVDQYGISGRNLMSLNLGCTPVEQAQRAEFDDPPRIVYLGHLGLLTIDLPLLARLSKIYPHIDVYGGPPPDPALGLRYLGYAPQGVLGDYQLGLITCTRDLLMREGHAAKHVTYFSYGLPVLVPAWRRLSPVLIPGSTPYTEETFQSVVERMSDRTRWQSVSDEAYAQSHKLSWEENLRPLEYLLRDMP